MFTQECVTIMYSFITLFSHMSLCITEGFSHMSLCITEGTFLLYFSEIQNPKLYKFRDNYIIIGITCNINCVPMIEKSHLSYNCKISNYIKYSYKIKCDRFLIFNLITWYYCSSVFITFHRV